jgi:hypothetical protein
MSDTTTNTAELVASVTSAEARLTRSLPPILSITAIGEVSSLGWSGAELSPYIYIEPPADGLWDFDFVAVPPSGFAGQQMCAISAQWEGEAESWVKGVRIHSKTNSTEDAA